MKWSRSVLLCTIGIGCAVPAYAQRGSGIVPRGDSIVPPSPRAQKLQLRQPFTLTYRADARALHDGSFRRYRVRLTLSYDGKRLLYRWKDLAVGRTVTELFDGRETYEAETGSRIAMIRPGFDPMRLWLCPLPGVGIPHMPMFTYGEPSWFHPEDDKSLEPKLASLRKYVSPSLYNAPHLEREYGTWYYDGRAARTQYRGCPVVAAVIPSEAAPKVLWYATFENPAAAPYELWEFFSHKRFSGVWLAARIQLRVHGYDSARGPTTLVREANYKLEEAVERPLEPSAYDPATYLSEHANVTDTAGSSVRTFLYEPGQGSLQEQRRRGVDVAEQAAKAARSPVNTGLVGLGVLAVVAAVWIIWRKRHIR